MEWIDKENRIAITALHNNKKSCILELLKPLNITCVFMYRTIETIMNQNYFRFNNKIYKQEDGISMGSPTSNILSEIFLQNLRKIILTE